MYSWDYEKHIHTLFDTLFIKILHYSIGEEGNPIFEEYDKIIKKTIKFNELAIRVKYSMLTTNKNKNRG
tara:strand:- start:38 stop:244 length:207 start_codon:yes stop_codon:yes gene_type:complete